MTLESNSPFSNNQETKSASILETLYINDEELQKIISDITEARIELSDLREQIAATNADQQAALRHTALTTKISTLEILKQERQLQIRTTFMENNRAKYEGSPQEDAVGPEGVLKMSGNGFDSFEKRGSQG